MYSPKYGDTCECPYCGHVQDDIDLEEVWNEEVDCEKCEGKFRYDLEITYEFTCEPIEGEGPEEIDGVPGPKWIDPNQVNLFQEASTCSKT
jgi:hypothetical protein